MRDFENADFNIASMWR